MHGAARLGLLAGLLALVALGTWATLGYPGRSGGRDPSGPPAAHGRPATCTGVTAREGGDPGTPSPHEVGGLGTDAWVFDAVPAKAPAQVTHGFATTAACCGRVGTLSDGTIEMSLPSDDAPWLAAGPVPVDHVRGAPGIGPRTVPISALVDRPLSLFLPADHVSGAPRTCNGMVPISALIDRPLSLFLEEGRAAAAPWWLQDYLPEWLRPSDAPMEAQEPGAWLAERPRLPETLESGVGPDPVLRRGATVAAQETP